MSITHYEVLFQDLGLTLRSASDLPLTHLLQIYIVLAEYFILKFARGLVRGLVGIGQSSWKLSSGKVLHPPNALIPEARSLFIDALRLRLSPVAS